MSEQGRDARLHVAVTDLLARAMEMSSSGKFIVLITDPDLSEPGMSAHGPFEGSEAVMVAEQLRASYASTADMVPGDDLSDVKVSLVPWEEWVL